MVDLFVDVTAELMHSPEKARIRSTLSTNLGGAAHHLLRTPTPFTLVRGAPGQGKSTLSQYICQVHRSAFLPESERPQTLPALEKPRFPIRFDLSDYALWLAGTDVWDHSDDRVPKKAKARRGETATVECFIADLMTYESGGITTSADTVQDTFERVPSLVVLDGLDEVGSSSVRRRVVNEINAFAGRGKAYTDPPKVVVTTRPSAGELPEPAHDRFEIITLNQLTGEQRADYLRKWCAVRGIRSKDGRALRKSFQEKSREPYIFELAGNPMQLTILLDLLHRQGAATPTQRTDLYDTYVDLLLAREANKHPKAVRDHKEELLETIPFLGWYLHAQTEESQVNGRMSINDLKAAMRHFQRTYGNQESIVDELFKGLTDRLWALTSQVDGTYEFEVLSLREYFAARFLYRNAGEDNSHFDSTTVLRELLRRPYWLNTARFYGGNAKGSDVYVLAAGVEQELSNTSASASYLAAWALLTDGVFQRRPHEARKVLTALCSDVGVGVLLAALDRRDITILPEMPKPTAAGADPTWTRLTTLISTNPGDSANRQRVRVLRELLNQRVEFAEWWFQQLTGSIGTDQQNAWLAIGASCDAGAGTTADLENMNLSDGAAELFLSTGLTPTPGSSFEQALLTAVLDGECPYVTSTCSLPAQVAVALTPGELLTSSSTGFISGDDRAKRRRAEAVSQLRKAGSPWEAVAKKRAFKSGYKGSTFPWADTATAVHEHVGHCWVASEIAIIGAASPFKLAYSKQPGKTAFGATSHPSELLAQTRANSGRANWWREQLRVIDSDDLGRAEWALAVWCVASGPTVSELLPELTEVLTLIPHPLRRTVTRAVERIARFGWLGERLVNGDSSDAKLAALNELRASTLTQEHEGAPHIGDQHPLPSLLSVARAEHWLKVDTVGAYR